MLKLVYYYKLISFLKKCQIIKMEQVGIQGICLLPSSQPATTSAIKSHSLGWMKTFQLRRKRKPLMKLLSGGDGGLRSEGQKKSSFDNCYHHPSRQNRISPDPRS